MRIGPKMSAVVNAVARHNGRATLIDVAREVGPHGSLHYGYQTVGRALAAGLVGRAAPLPGRRGLSLVLLSGGACLGKD